ncbi:vacuolar protein sorting-associated protein 72 homolog [Rhopilema esculentum]|uniref:vacuolar protein sorting-associated protein 72 homolog n=1 Tax=Rhopilema esculentum TaxID=499914 RepID=UPI0031CE14A5|eukprot:gene6904-12515_t
MAAERSRRQNAGTKMQKLIEDEEEDDFYKTTYGGFDEEDNDNVYETEDDDDDVVDSDFSIDENEEVKSEEEDERPRKRKKTVVKTFKALKKSDETKSKTTQKIKSTLKLKRPTEQASNEERKKTFRSSTLQKSEDSTGNVKTPTKRVYKQPELRRLTQKELLAEAKITAEKNLASLAAFLKLEAEKKKTKLHKVCHAGPIVRFHSVTMPIVEEDDAKVVDGEEQLDDTSATKKCSRNFMIFTDLKNFPHGYFPDNKPGHQEKPLCVITGLPAKYKDPLTSLPFATLEAFKVIRSQHNPPLASQKLQNSDGSNSRTRRR